MSIIQQTVLQSQYYFIRDFQKLKSQLYFYKQATDFFRISSINNTKNTYFYLFTWAFFAF